MSSSDNTAALGYAVQEIHIGVVSSHLADDIATTVAQKLRRMFPDRIRTHLISESTAWSDQINLLVVCCSRGLSKETAEWIQTSVQDRTVLVWTDFDLDRNLEDRQNFYDTLVVGGLSKVVPRRVLLTPIEVDVFGRKLVDAPDASEHSTGTTSTTSIFLDRQDQLEITGVILLKPILQRPLDPNDPTVTIYYPRSQGGGAKTLQFLDDKELNVPNFTAHFDPNIRFVPREASQPILYEELLLPAHEEETTGGVIVRRRERKRDRFKKFMKKLGGADDTHHSHFGDDDQISHESDLSRMDRKIVVVTTAALPWM
jgi:hypothetical protein